MELQTAYTYCKACRRYVTMNILLACTTRPGAGTACHCEAELAMVGIIERSTSSVPMICQLYF
eukprot:172302-Pleurochrysis_carterae.AAC.1